MRPSRQWHHGITIKLRAEMFFGTNRPRSFFLSQKFQKSSNQNIENKFHFYLRAFLGVKNLTFCVEQAKIILSKEYALRKYFKEVGVCSYQNLTMRRRKS
jgi:hypothetical protein